MLVRRRAIAWHLVKFCPPSALSKQQPVAIVDYQLFCGHVLRLRHFGPKARIVQKGISVIPPTGWNCPVCVVATVHALICARRWLCSNRA